MRTWVAFFHFLPQFLEDFNEIHTIVGQLRLVPKQVWIMPEGTLSEDILWNAKNIQDRVLAYGWNFTLRQQILLHDDARGV